MDEWVATPVGDAEAGETQVAVPGRPEEFAGESAVKYKTRFEDPRGPDDDVVILELRGLYAHATVEATGERLDGDWPVEHDTYFEPLRVAFRPYDENELVVTCREPQDRFGGIHDTDMVPAADCVPGIWWGVSMEPRSLPTITQFETHSELTDDGGVLHTKATVLAADSLSDRITYSVRTTGEGNTRGMMERESVETEQGGTHRVDHAIQIRDPTLWWPRELGRQHRYTVRAKFDEETRTATTGFCSSSFEDGQFLINGEPLNVRGVNLLTASPDDVDRALGVNANLVRAHAQVLPPAVYEACDEQGLLVWQDLPLTGPGSFDTERGETLASALSGYCRSHPSITAVGVHDDPSDAFADGLGSGLVDRLRLQWRAWRSSYDAGPAETVAEAVSLDSPVFPVVGGPGIGDQVGAYYPGWDYGEPADIDSLLDRYPVDVVAEYGAGSFGGDGSDDPGEFDPRRANLAGFDSSKHRRHVDDGAEASQSYQAGLLQTITETLRRTETGAIAFALTDTDDAGMGVYDRTGEPKASKAALKRAFAPLQAFLVDPMQSRSEVVVVNDTPSDYAPTLDWTAGGEEGSLDLDVDAHAQWRGGPIALPTDADAATLTLRIDDYEIQNHYDF
jgi:beta-mannosidase